GQTAQRCSLEWSRIEPEEGRFSTEAIAHYREVMEALRERGMEPVVTIHHFTLPRWLAEKGGWESGDIERRFERFVVRVVEEYRELARWLVQFIELVVNVFQNYVNST